MNPYSRKDVKKAARKMADETPGSSLAWRVAGAVILVIIILYLLSKVL